MDPDKLVNAASEGLPEFATHGGIVAALVYFYSVARRMKRQWHQDTTDDHKDRAESEIYKSLREEVSRTSASFTELKEAHKTEITELKKIHKEEIKELEERINDMEEKLTRLNVCLETHKTMAIETLSATAECNRTCATLPAIKSGLKQLVKAAPPHQPIERAKQ